MTVEALGLYDPFSHTVWEDPYPVYRQLREKHPLYRNEERDCWVASRYEDIEAISRDVETFSVAGGVDFDLPEYYLGPGDMLAVDPPIHTRLRKVVREQLTPKAIERLESMLRSQVRTVLDRMLERGEGDAAAELAFPLPMSAILALMGFPDEDGPQLREWLDATAYRTPGSPDRPPETDAAHDALAEYVAMLLEERRREPREDIVTVMARAVEGGSMSLEETKGMSLLMLTAGWETTASLIGNALYHLARNPDQRTILVKDPATIAAGVEEVLRYDAPVQYLHRTVTREVTMHDETVPAGGKVLLLYASGNRDERRWDDPDSLDVLRPPQRNVAFGNGIHLCLGAPLARIECRIVLEEILSRAPEYEIAGPIERIEAHVLRGIHRLPLRLVAA